MRDRDDLDKLAEAYSSVPNSSIKVRQGIGDWTNDQTLNEAGLLQSIAGGIKGVKDWGKQKAQGARQGWEDAKATVGGRDSLSMDPAERAARDAGFSSVAGKEAEQQAAQAQVGDMDYGAQYAAHAAGEDPSLAGYDPNAAATPEDTTAYNFQQMTSKPPGWEPETPPTPAEGSPDEAADGAETDATGTETAAGGPEAKAKAEIDKLTPEAKQKLLADLTAELGVAAPPAGATAEVSTPAPAPAEAPVVDPAAASATEAPAPKARKPRDYKAEYARTKELKAQKAAAA